MMICATEWTDTELTWAAGQPMLQMNFFGIVGLCPFYVSRAKK